MKSKVIYHLIFNRQNRLRRDGTASIHILIYQNKKKKYINTGINVTPEQWDDKRKIITDHPHAQELNWMLRKKLDQLQQFEAEKYIQFGYFELEMFDELLKNEERDFWELFYKYAERNDLSISRKNYILRTIKKLKEFDQHLSFNKLTYNKIVEFDFFLRSQDYHTNTVAHFHKVLRAFLTQMVKSEVIPKNPYLKFKIKTEKTEKEFLTDLEVRKIEELQIENTDIEYIKDMFLFSCYTGLRFSDLQALTPKNFDFTDDGIYMKVKQQKTKSTVSMPIHLLFNGKAIGILQKYYAPDKDRLFPKITNQAANRILKIIQLGAGLKKKLTFHIARHTFGTLLALYAKDPYLIKQLMGHADIETSMTYIHLSNEIMKEKLKKIDWSKYSTK